MYAECSLIQDRLFTALHNPSSAVLSFVSAVSGEGTTTVLLNLGLAMSRSNRKVLLVDAQPNGGLSELLGMTGRKGLGDYMLGKVALAEIVHLSDDNNISLIPIGISGAIDSSRYDWTQMIFDVRVGRDIVLFDLPPVMSSGLAMRIAPSTDGLILVVAAHQTRREIVLRTKIELDRGTGIKFIGTILNRRQYFTPTFIDRHL